MLIEISGTSANIKACHYHHKGHKMHLSMSLTLPMLRLLSSTAQGRKELLKRFKPCNVGIHWKALAEYFQMSTDNQFW